MFNHKLKRFQQGNTYGSTRWRAKFQNGWNVYGSTTCLEGIIYTDSFVHPPESDFFNDYYKTNFSKTQNVFIYRGKNNNYVVNEDTLKKYRKIYKASCLGKYLIYNKQHPIYLKLPSTSTRSLLILVVGFARYTWDLAGGLTNSQIIDAIVYWYEKGYTADQAMVLGSYLDRNECFYVPRLLGHTVFTLGSSYPGVARLLPQILESAEQGKPIPTETAYLSSVITRVQKAHHPGHNRKIKESFYSLKHHHTLNKKPPSFIKESKCLLEELLNG